MPRKRNKKILRILLKKDITQRDLAREMGITPPCINEVIHNNNKNPRIRKFIASRLGYPENELWPE